MEKRLTLKQQRFIKEYIKTGNGTQSAIKAGYSAHSAREIAKENITKPLVKEHIEKVMSEVSDKIGLTAEKVLSKLNNILDKDDDKLLPHILKAAELSGKHLRLWNENEHKIDIVKDHQERQKQIEELE